MKQTVIIGIAGGTASGKTSIANEVCQRFLDKKAVTIIRQDDYYKDQSHLSMAERIKTNYDHPLAFDTELLVYQLQKLKNRQPIIKPIYDYVAHTRSQDCEKITIHDVIILEGIFVLAEQTICNLCDIKIFVDAEADIRFIRRLERDINKRGRSVDSIISQYLTTVKPMHDQFIEPSKKFADIIVPIGGANKVAIDLLITKIASLVK